MGRRRRVVGLRRRLGGDGGGGGRRGALRPGAAVPGAAAEVALTCFLAHQTSFLPQCESLQFLIRWDNQQLLHVQLQQIENALSLGSSRSAHSDYTALFPPCPHMGQKWMLCLYQVDSLLRNSVKFSHSRSYGD